jgi:hypothetical protein
MSAINRTPQNTNYLQASKFLLSFDRITTVQYFCQEVNLPGVSMGKAQLNTPMLDIYSPGNKLTYNSLNITFTIDESLSSWIELYNWFRSMASPDNAERNSLSAQQSTRRYGQQSFSDATLNILSGLNNPLVKIKFKNLFPTSLSDLDFDVKSSADNILSATASFNYDYFLIESL